MNSDHKVNTWQKGTPSGKSPYAFAHKHMFGWGGGADKILLGIAVYDTRPHVLQSCAPVSLSKPIWNIVSEFLVVTPIVFEIWKYGDERGTGNTYVNWYGQMTYGTCWFRGCKIWLTPAAGLMMSLGPYGPLGRRSDVPREAPKTHRSWAAKRAHLEWKVNTRALASTSAKMKYDTSRFPYRVGSPREFVKDVKRDIVVTIADPTEDDFDKAFYDQHLQDTCERARAAFVLSRIVLPKVPTFSIIPAGHHISPSDSSEGGTPEIAMLMNSAAVFAELEWIQDVGEKNHGISFYWL